MTTDTNENKAKTQGPRVLRERVSLTLAPINVRWARAKARKTGQTLSRAVDGVLAGARAAGR
jgi:hypothetical protein